MAKKLEISIGADEGEAVQALNNLKVSLSQINTAFKTINAAQKAASKDSTKNSGGIFDPKELNRVGAQLKGVTDTIRSMGVSQKQMARDSGFNAITKGFDDINYSAKGLFKTLGSLLPEFSLLTGAGIVGGLAKLANAFGERSTQVATANYQTGFSPKSVYNLQNLGQAAGISPDSTASGLNTYSQTVRNIALNGDQATLGYLQNISKITNIRGKYNDPTQREKLLQDLMRETGRVSRQNPAAGQDLQNTLGLNWAQPLLMLSDEQRNAAQAAATRAFVANPQQQDQGREEYLAKGRAGLRVNSLYSRIGAKTAPYFTDFYDLISGSLGNGVAAKSIRDDMDQDPIVSLFKNKIFPWFKSGDGKTFSGSGDPLGDISSGTPDPFGDFRIPSKAAAAGAGISLNGPAPADQSTKIIVEFQNAPRGMKVRTDSTSDVKVLPNINYSSFP